MGTKEVEREPLSFEVVWFYRTLQVGRVVGPSVLPFVR